MNPNLTSTEPNAIVDAASWLQSALIGSVATSVAIIAVGWLGLMLIAGRLPSRRATQLVLGCFIVFGASSIAAGIVSSFWTSGPDVPTSSIQPSPLDVVPAAGYPPGQIPSYDPYAGAALPPR